jgi:beta-fructofuranosidase
MSTTRRRFIGAAAFSALTWQAHRLLAQETSLVPAATLANDPMRPQFHLLPARNWMNDPNGPIYLDGKYHMFFQYNPHAAVWGNMSWAHSISSDMLHWTNYPVAFTESPNSPDSAGCFSGSTIAVHEGNRRRVYAVYTGVVISKDQATIRAEGLKETQCLAWSDDPMLKQWTRQPDPIVALPPPGLKVTGFRDPSVWKLGDLFYMTVGSGIEQVGGCVLLYQSKDLKTWEYLHTLADGQWNGKANKSPVSNGEMWECPEFFPLDSGHVLIYSTMGKVYWQSGALDVATMKFKPAKTGLLDLDAFYAPKTQLDAQGRRILWGWIPERRPESAMKLAGWSGMMSLPRVMNLDPDGTLRINILPQSTALRSAPVQPKQTPTGLLTTLHQASGEVLCTGTEGGALQFTISDGTTELLRVIYSPEQHSFSFDGHEIALQPNDVPTLHAFVDGSVIELIASSRIGYTKRFYPATKTAPDILVHASGTAAPKLSAWTVAPISSNRLTTGA